MNDLEHAKEKALSGELKATNETINAETIVKDDAANVSSEKPDVDPIDAEDNSAEDSIRCHTNFRHPFNLSWSGKTCDIRRSSKTTSQRAC